MANQTSTDNYYSPDQAASLLRVSTKELLALAKTTAIKSTRIKEKVGKQTVTKLLFQLADLINYRLRERES